ncbi:hypothetical protein [Nitrosomonas sp. Is37]|uniref:hypothetical protein n=1 Tax=Nitrosomonas sp. Is37 TaxID=3080535 RepID=UPI00294B2151|nr:hypothetical protein [Nitrosomonas sp. Is37]MDV6343692.1 hypothetical protein [Nitrosomonas sp. Is37]
MSELNKFIAGLLNNFSLSAVTDRSWFEIASILTPSIILILTLFGFSFILQKRNWKIVIYITCLLLTLLFLPYELFRQSTAISKAEANIGEMQASLKTLLNASDLNQIENLADKEVTSSILEEMIGNLDQKEKKEVLLISLLAAENEKQSLRLLEDKHKHFSDEIKSSISDAKKEIINTREPIDKISGDILKQIDRNISHLIENKMQSFNQVSDEIKSSISDAKKEIINTREPVDKISDDILKQNRNISHLIENKMQSFNQAIDHSLKTFQQGINSFVQNELEAHEKTLVTLTQKSIGELGNELKDYINETKQEITNQIQHANNEPLQKLDVTQRSIDQLGNTVGNINLDKVIAHIKQLSTSIDLLQKQNEVQFEYNECIRSVGWIDLVGKEEECKKKLYMSMNEMINKFH